MHAKFPAHLVYLILRVCLPGCLTLSL